MLVGLLGLYVLWLVIGYLRVSQVGLGEGRAQPVDAVPSGGDAGRASPPRGVPYCPFDGLSTRSAPASAPRCERDLLLDCVNCGATVAAGEASCYRCGTPTGAVDTSLLG